MKIFNVIILLVLSSLLSFATVSLAVESQLNKAIFEVG